MYAKSPQSCPTFCNPMDQVPLSMGFSRQEYWMEWVAGPSSRDLPDPGIEPASLMSPAVAGEFFTTSTTWEAPLNVSPTQLPLARSAKGLWPLPRPLNLRGSMTRSQKRHNGPNQLQWKYLTFANFTKTTTLGTQCLWEGNHTQGSPV